jgi:hypothetical protein
VRSNLGPSSRKTGNPINDHGADDLPSPSRYKSTKAVPAATKSDPIIPTSPKLIVIPAGADELYLDPTVYQNAPLLEDDQ